MSNRIQILLYNQLNQSYVANNVDHVLVACVPTFPIPNTPVGNLYPNQTSRLYSFAAQYDLVEEMKKSSACGEWHFCIGDSYKDIVAAQSFYRKDSEVLIMEPAEPYMMDTIESLKEAFGDDNVVVLPNTQFLLSRDQFNRQYDTPPIMESFYRRIRKKTGILMEKSGDPVGGKRNFDKQNRKYDKSFDDVDHYTPHSTVGREKACEYYNVSQEYRLPTTRDKAVRQLDFFIENLLDRFGELEDAMYDTSHAVYHSEISAAMNIGLLHPREVIDAVASAPTAINNKEGFVRQVLGRREYMYHRLWHYKDSIYNQNALNQTIPLPSWFRNPDKSPLKMHCVDSVLHKVKNTAYSHHIERLMIIGNFCLLVGYNPHDVNKWFWEMYVDAYERVVSPNVLGMSQYADGGNLATKPYVSSANYINKMSNFCSSCHFDPKKKEGENACPFNYLFWEFVHKNKKVFQSGRQGFIVKQLDKKNVEQIYHQSAAFRNRIDAE